MKKLLVLVLVLSIATVASAALKITGAPTQLMPSETAVIGIMTDAALQYQSAMYAAIVSSPEATVDITSGITVVADSGMTLEHSAPVSEYVTGLPAGLDGMGVNLFVLDLTGGIAAGTQLFNGIIIHCNSPIEATVSLVLLNDNFEYVQVLDSVVIQQIPEPMTLGLLGIGGLFLRRRK